MGSTKLGTHLAGQGTATTPQQEACNFIWVTLAKAQEPKNERQQKISSSEAKASCITSAFSLKKSTGVMDIPFGEDVEAHAYP